MSFIIIITPLTARVVGAPQMILQPVFSIFPCSPLPSGTYQTPGLSIPWCCLPTSPSVCLFFFPLSLCLARRFWLDLISVFNACKTLAFRAKMPPHRTCSQNNLFKLRLRTTPRLAIIDRSSGAFYGLTAPFLMTRPVILVPVSVDSRSWWMRTS